MEESWSSGVGGAPLLRTRSLPLVLEAGSGVPQRQPKLDARQLLTLTRHYYPEGGWGWGVACAATLAQLLAHGLHQAAAVLALEAVRRFGPEFRMQTGIQPDTVHRYPQRRLHFVCERAHTLPCAQQQFTACSISLPNDAFRCSSITFPAWSNSKNRRIADKQTPYLRRAIGRQSFPPKPAGTISQSALKSRLTPRRAIYDRGYSFVDTVLPLPSRRRLLRQKRSSALCSRIADTYRSSSQKKTLQHDDTPTKLAALEPFLGTLSKYNLSGVIQILPHLNSDFSSLSQVTQILLGRLSGRAESAVLCPNVVDNKTLSRQNVQRVELIDTGASPARRQPAYRLSAAGDAPPADVRRSSVIPDDVRRARAVT
ncbi:hypothetical protein EVAR_41235_1 [Eumeta japonica]|uniref:Uncharacterized protein n=1 Tax=Eumeta variegata TaxID=151549 RepID=A0A4C1W6Y5_EUMVA|nr:hypothetical protein EVAR_41235_1 [Eumeta japonica]